MPLADIGLIGLAVMGENLVLNMERNGFTVAVYNRTTSKVDDFINGQAAGKNIIGTHSLEELVSSIGKPRKLMLMVKAGTAVDDLVKALIPLLDEGDVIIDGGNSHYPDTIRRTAIVEDMGLHFMGVGVSGGEKGALMGPSIMPGGSHKAWKLIQPIFQAIAAKVSDGGICCQYVGADGAGHFVKMVHNGIEYGDMQLISEAYFLLSRVCGLSAAEMHNIFDEWNKGELNSYLIEITRDILATIDPLSGKPLVELILDEAGQKGTGLWTSQAALELGIAAPTVAEAVFARSISAIKSQRVEASKLLKAPEYKYVGNTAELVEAVRQALFVSKICSYAQGFQLMRSASEKYDWKLNYGEIALMWRGGCIIRAQFLDRIEEAFHTHPDLANLMLAPYFRQILNSYQPAWRHVVATAVQAGVAVPAFSSALAYFDGYRSETLPANMIQAQRDYFGAHTYKRIDRDGVFHTEWGE